MSASLRRPVAALYDLRKWLLSRQWFTSKILPAIPRSIRWRLRRLYFLPADIIERRSRRRDDLVPPKSEIFTGSVDDFTSSGAALVGRLVEFAGLTSDMRVLDIGSGTGRLAVALTSYLSAEGSYAGMDIVPAGIRWCQEKITPRYPRFSFTLTDVYNKEYNPGGTLRARDYRFPYPDGTFDIAVLASVFTHMLPEDMEHYVAEIARMLKKQGRCYASFSLINSGSRDPMETGRSSLRFKQYTGACWVVDAKVPELAVGYDETYVRGLYERQGFRSSDIHYGSWSGRFPAGQEPAFSQDIVVSTKQ
jgi:SAM-dependent methyltransferase